MPLSIPVASPALIGNERAYLLDCLDHAWIAQGPYIERFESACAEVCATPHAVACSSGTAALHLALHAIGIAPGDEIIVPSLSFVATANAVRYCGATPIFAECDAQTWTIDVDDAAHLITPRTKAIIAVHLYGHPAPLEPLVALARHHDLVLIEDAAEAIGAAVLGRPVGGWGDIGIISFFANKIITTGEGGMLLCKDATIAQRARLLRNHAQDPQRRYWHTEIGFNYRLSNLAAAIGLAQIEQLDWHLARRRAIAQRYRELLGGHSAITLQHTAPWATHVWWMNTILLQPPVQRDAIAQMLAEYGVETRPCFYPLHTLPIYTHLTQRPLPIAEAIAAQGLTLPSGASLTDEEIVWVSGVVTNAIAHIARH